MNSAQRRKKRRQHLTDAFKLRSFDMRRVRAQAQGKPVFIASLSEMLHIFGQPKPFESALLSEGAMLSRVGDDRALQQAARVAESRSHRPGLIVAPVHLMEIDHSKVEAAIADLVNRERTSVVAFETSRGRIAKKRTHWTAPPASHDSPAWFTPPVQS